MDTSWKDYVYFEVKLQDLDLLRRVRYIEYDTTYLL